MPSKIDGDDSGMDDLQTMTTHPTPTNDFDLLLNDDAAMLDFMVSTLYMFFVNKS